LDLVANDNNHHREPKFDSEDEHHHFHIDIFQTFFTRLPEQEQIPNKLLKHASYKIINDPMPNDQLECAPLAWTVFLHTVAKKHSRQSALLQTPPILLM
jgi:hypothetical protein